MCGIKNVYPIHLPQADNDHLQGIINKGIHNARTITRARVLLMANAGKTDREIYEALKLAVSTPYDIRKRYHEGGVKRALHDLPRPGQSRKLTGAQEAEVIATACSKAPKGHVRWTLNLLTEKLKSKLPVSVCRNTIWKVLLRNKIKPWRKKNVGYSQSNAAIY